MRLASVSQRVQSQRGHTRRAANVLAETVLAMATPLPQFAGPGGEGAAVRLEPFYGCGRRRVADAGKSCADENCTKGQVVSGGIFEERKGWRGEPERAYDAGPCDD